jgi:DNA-binding transcriptional ArsR family regulator
MDESRTLVKPASDLPRRISPAPEPTEALFAALSDPTRRQVIASLSERETATATGLAEEIPVSRQAIAKHLASLEEAGLVSAERIGRERRYRLTPAPLAEAVSWIAAVGAQWDERLARLSRLAKRSRG